MHRLTPILAVACIITATPANAQAPVLGVVVPLSGTVARLGGQMRDGALAAARNAAGAVRLEIVDDNCSEEGGVRAAEELLAREVRLVIGFICSDPLEAALPLLSEAGIPVITAGVRATWLTDRRARNGWLAYRIAPRADQERQAVSELLVRRWAGVPFAIVDDGTIHGRDLAENFRLAAEEAGLRPVLVDNYRPGLDDQSALAALLRRAGASHVFVGGDRQDVARLARDAAGLGFDLTIAGGEALRAASPEPDLAAGTLMIGLPDGSEAGGAAFQQAMLAQGSEPRGYALPGFAAVELAIDALARNAQTGRPLPEVLDSGSFETAAGRIAFDAKGDWRANPYRLMRYDGEKFVQVE